MVCKVSKLGACSDDLSVAGLSSVSHFPNTVCFHFCVEQARSWRISKRPNASQYFEVRLRHRIPLSKDLTNERWAIQTSLLVHFTPSVCSPCSASAWISSRSTKRRAQSPSSFRNLSFAPLQHHTYVAVSCTASSTVAQCAPTSTPKEGSMCNRELFSITSRVLSVDAGTVSSPKEFVHKALDMRNDVQFLHKNVRNTRNALYLASLFANLLCFVGLYP